MEVWYLITYEAQIENCEGPVEINFKRDIPTKVFALIKLQLKQNCPDVNVKETKWTWTIQIKDEETLRELLHFGKRHKCIWKTKYEDGEDILTRDLGSEGHMKILCSPRNPFTIKMSFSRQCATIYCSFGHWNINGVPQHR